MTACEEPYIGDESIMRPPASKKARITSAQASRATAVVADVEGDPAAEPTSGTASPVDGIGRVKERRSRRGRCNRSSAGRAEEPRRVNGGIWHPPRAAVCRERQTFSVHQPHQRAAEVGLAHRRAQVSRQAAPLLRVEDAGIRNAFLGIASR